MPETPDPRYVWLVREDTESEGIVAPITTAEMVAFATEEAARAYADDLWFATHVRTGRSIITRITRARIWNWVPARTEVAPEQA
jgi:hypothetical protein